MMVSPWFKNAVFYSLDVETFLDSNADGVGDFAGLTSKLDYLAGLGITCIWLLPFFPSPNRDNGYDVKDYYGVDERLGTIGDFVIFMDTCRNYGIKVMIDLVINHTSVEHPWFQSARKDRNSIYRDFYVWSDKPRKFPKNSLMFKGEEDTIWTFDEEAQQYYLHRFYKEQPDLNISSPRLREEILKIIGFWLQLGVSGFRIDATEMLIDSYGLKKSDQKYIEHFLNELRTFVTSRNPRAILLAETNLPPEQMKVYMKKGERIHMFFNFYLNQHLFLSLATGDARPVKKALQKIPPLDEEHQWLNFLRHHDELSLKLLTRRDQEKVFQKFAPKKQMRIYGAGIRRRILPMFNGNRKLLELAYSLLYSLPGAPLLRYGDEIGMGDDLALEGRTSVRTPMQWSEKRNSGFSSGPEEIMVHPLISEGKFSYPKVNVTSAQNKPSSFLNWMERIITTRKQTPEIGSGTLSVLRSSTALLIHSLRWKNVTMVFVHNFGPRKVTVERRSLGLGAKSFSTIFCSHSLKERAGRFVIAPMSYQWLRIEDDLNVE